MQLFWALQSRNWNARFCSTRKENWKASKNVQKSEITLINLCHPVNAFTACNVFILKRVVHSWLQSADFNNVEWIKSSNKYLPQQFFKRQIIFKAREYLIKNTIGYQVFISFNQLKIYQACLLCNRLHDRKFVSATRVVRSA